MMGAYFRRADLGSQRHGNQIAHRSLPFLAYFLQKLCECKGGQICQKRAQLVPPAEPRSSTAMDSSKQHQILQFLRQKSHGWR